VPSGVPAKSSNAQTLLQGRGLNSNALFQPKPSMFPSDRIHPRQQMLCGSVGLSVSTSRLRNVNLLKAKAVEEGRDGSAGVLAGGIEDAVGEGCLLELTLRFGASIGFEVLIGGN
jgi:hypothetical protein